MSLKEVNHLNAHYLLFPHEPSDPPSDHSPAFHKRSGLSIHVIPHSSFVVGFVSSSCLTCWYKRNQMVHPGHASVFGEIYPFDGNDRTWRRVSAAKRISLHSQWWSKRVLKTFSVVAPTACSGTLFQSRHGSFRSQSSHDTSNKNSQRKTLNLHNTNHWLTSNHDTNQWLTSNHDTNH